jgi:hypothetical protein
LTNVTTQVEMEAEIALNRYAEQVWIETNSYWIEVEYYFRYWWIPTYGLEWKSKPFEHGYAMDALCLSRLGRTNCALDFGMNPEW